MKPLLISGVFLLNIFFANAQPPTIQWQKCLGGTLFEAAYTIIQSTDGGYLLGGFASSDDGDVSGNHLVNHPDFWVVKLDSNGILQWQRCYGSTGNDLGYSMVLTEDHGFVMAIMPSANDGDVTGSGYHGVGDFWIVKCDSVGNIEWKKCYGGTGQDQPFEIAKCYDGGYIIIGETFSQDFDVVGFHDSTLCPGTCTDVWITKIDSVGNLQWAKCYGGSFIDEGHSIVQAEDSGYVFAAITYSNDGDVSGHHSYPGGTDYWIVKIDPLGSIQWQKCVGGSSQEGTNHTVSVRCANDGGYILIGNTESNDFDVSGLHGYDDTWLLKFDASGTIQWQKCLGGSIFEDGFKIFQLENNNYITLSETQSIDGDVTYNHSYLYQDIWLACLDSGGNLLWQQCYGGTGDEWAYDFVYTVEQNIVIAASTNSNNGDVSGNHGAQDFWVVKLNPLTDAIIETHNPITDFGCYLNSNQEKLSINFFDESSEEVSVQLIDITGRIILHHQLTTTPSYNSHEIRIGELNNGVYLVRLETKSGSVVKKVLNNP